MFSDSQQTGSYVDRIDVVKVHRIGGSLWGLAGAMAEGVAVLNWLNGSDKPVNLKRFEALQLNAEGKVFHWDESLVPVEVGAPATAGSGGEYAMGAMMAGASPKKAVEIACELDTRSGGKIRGLKL